MACELSSNDRCVVIRSINSSTGSTFEDSNPPDTTITSGPTGTTRDRQPTFKFKSSESSSTFECRYDSEAFRPCSGNGSDKPATALSFGTHTFSVRAVDAATCDI